MEVKLQGRKLQLNLDHLLSMEVKLRGRKLQLQQGHLLTLEVKLQGRQLLLDLLLILVRQTSSSLPGTRRQLHLDHLQQEGKQRRAELHLTFHHIPISIAVATYEFLLDVRDQVLNTISMFMLLLMLLVS
jgi:hypothetical protein